MHIPFYHKVRLNFHRNRAGQSSGTCFGCVLDIKLNRNGKLQTCQQSVNVHNFRHQRNFVFGVDVGFVCAFGVLGKGLLLVAVRVKLHIDLDVVKVVL